MSICMYICVCVCVCECESIDEGVGQIAKRGKQRKFKKKIK